MTDIRRRPTRVVHVLVLPGGEEHSHKPVPWFDGPRMRMRPIVEVLRNLHTPPDTRLAVTLVRYAVQGWNGDERSPVADAAATLAASRRRHGPGPAIAVGHSMGGRAAVHLAAHTDDVIGIIGLAPWWPPGELAALPVTCRVRVAHDRDDRTTSPAQSLAEVRAFRERGGDATWTSPAGGPSYRPAHALMWRPRWWHRYTARAVRALLPR